MIRTVCGKRDCFLIMKTFVFVFNLRRFVRILRIKKSVIKTTRAFFSIEFRD